ncbi:oxalate:formate antiporter-like [Physella acuta]|uniref:oxalate:formate antiporter-like n=1 Tax=Physella acuta TaxID=109671 RepID=UPI0027DCF32C|nr:oxalate:formate antiporter-like [Physella acuta]
MSWPLFGIERWKGILVVFGGILIHLSLGTLYTFGNLNPYLTSYMRAKGTSASLTYTECSWIFALACMGQGASMALGGLIEKRIGPKLTALLGGWCMSLGVFLTYFAVKQSFALTIFTYGAVFGFGIGIVYAIPLACSMRWFPEKKGLVNGLVVAGFGGGAFIFNQIQTAFINPENKKPELEVNGEKYFDQPDVLDQVPYIFLILGGCYAGMQLIGSLLLCNPPPVEVTLYFETVNDMENDRDSDHDKTTLVPDKVTEDQKLLTKVEKTVNKGREEDDNLDVPPLQMLRDKNFYLIWFMFLLNGQGSVFISTLYKAYGQTFISDDSFLALVGAFAALFNAGGRIIWGILADKFSVRVALMITCASFATFMLTLQLSEYGGKPVFFLFVCLLFGSFSGSFALFPTATAKCFGRKYLSINYGLVFTSQMVTAPLGTFLSQSLKTAIGWSGLFFMVAGFSFASLIRDWCLLYSLCDELRIEEYLDAQSGTHAS